LEIDLAGEVDRDTFSTIQRAWRDHFGISFAFEAAPERAILQQRKFMPPTESNRRPLPSTNVYGECPFSTCRRFNGLIANDGPGA
jgi:hypothetical protein